MTAPSASPAAGGAGPTADLDRFAVLLLNRTVIAIRWFSWMSFGVGIGASALANGEMSGSPEFVRFVADGGYCLGAAACGWIVADKVARAALDGCGRG